MPKHNKPNRGSMAFSPRKRARSETPHISSWAAVDGDEPKILGFAGYKVGMSHIMAVDYRKNCLLYTSPSPRDRGGYRMPSSA